jgi:hypothetical protein
VAHGLSHIYLVLNLSLIATLPRLDQEGADRAVRIVIHEKNRKHKVYGEESGSIEDYRPEASRSDTNAIALQGISISLKAEVTGGLLKYIAIYFSKKFESALISPWTNQSKFEFRRTAAERSNNPIPVRSGNILDTYPIEQNGIFLSTIELFLHDY